jgi:chitinase
LAANYIPTYPRFWHATALVPWLYNPDTGIMISYDDPLSLTLKAAYVVRNQLSGVAIWQLSADDDNHSLLAALDAELSRPTTGGCHTNG